MRDWMVNRDESQLLVIDIQERLHAAMDRQSDYVDQAALLVRVARACGLPVVVSEQYPAGLGPTIPQIAAQTAGLEAHAKQAFSCLRDESLAQALRASGRRTVVIAGIEAHVCVMQTAFDLLQAGYRVVIAADAVCSRRAAERDTAQLSMRQAGAEIHTVEAIAFMWLERAGTPLFKQIAPWFR